MQGGHTYDDFFFSSRRRHTRLQGDWSSDVCSSDLRWTTWAAVWSASATVSARSKSCFSGQKGSTGNRAALLFFAVRPIPAGQPCSTLFEALASRILAPSVAESPVSEPAHPCHRCPKRRAPPAPLVAAAAVPGLCRARICGAQPLAHGRHGGLRLHAGAGPGPYLVAGTAHGGPAARIRGPAVVLAWRAGHAGSAFLAASGDGGTPALHRHAGAYADGHLVGRVLPGAHAGRAPRGLRLRRRGTAHRLCARHGRWRPAGPGGLPGPGPAFP